MAGQISATQTPEVVSHQQWVNERAAFLQKEKEFTRLRDELSRQRRELPWEEVTKSYVFDGPRGRETLAELFEERESADRLPLHVRPVVGRGVHELLVLWPTTSTDRQSIWRAATSAFAVISRAPLAKIEAYKQRMGWSFTWLSRSGRVQLRLRRFVRPEAAKSGNASYNYAHGGQRPGGDAGHQCVREGRRRVSTPTRRTARDRPDDGTYNCST